MRVDVYDREIEPAKKVHTSIAPRYKVVLDITISFDVVSSLQLNTSGLQ